MQADKVQLDGWIRSLITFVRDEWVEFRVPGLAVWAIGLVLVLDGLVRIFF